MQSSNRARFNPPPNWPHAEGFEPDIGWEPDRSLPPPPPGWPLWILGSEPLRKSRRPGIVPWSAVAVAAVLMLFFLVGPRHPTLASVPSLDVLNRPPTPASGPTPPSAGPGEPAVGPNGPAVGPNGPAVGPNGPAVGPNGPAVGPNGPAVGPNGPAVGPTNGPTGPTGPSESATVTITNTTTIPSTVTSTVPSTVSSTVTVQSTTTVTGPGTVATRTLPDRPASKPLPGGLTPAPGGTIPPR